MVTEGDWPGHEAALGDPAPDAAPSPEALLDPATKTMRRSPVTSSTSVSLSLLGPWLPPSLAATSSSRRHRRCLPAERRVPATLPARPGRPHRGAPSRRPCRLRHLGALLAVSERIKIWRAYQAGAGRYRSECALFGNQWLSFPSQGDAVVADIAQRVALVTPRYSPPSQLPRPFPTPKGLL